MTLNALYPNGVNKKIQQELYNKAVDSVKDRGNLISLVGNYLRIENRIHPFGHAELKEQLEDMEKLEEQMRRTTRGKSIRMSSGDLSARGA